MKKKYKGLNIPDFSYGTMGEMMACCNNVRIMDSCVTDYELKCEHCLFNFEDKKKHKIFRSWKKQNPARIDASDKKG